MKLKKLNRKQIRGLIQEYLPRRIPAETEQQRSAMSRGDQDGMGNRYMDAGEYYDGAIRRALQDARQAAQSGNVENMKSAHSYLGHLHDKMISLGMDPGPLEAEKEKLYIAIMTANYPGRRLGGEVPDRFRMEESYGDMIERRSARRQALNESFLDSIKSGISNITGIPTEKYLVTASSQDAYDLFDAMEGLGTDEDTIEDIVEKRAADLPALYAEYNKLILAWIAQSAAGIIASGEDAVLTHAKIDTFNSDLIQWLEDDGMAAAAETMTGALEAARMPRSNPPVSSPSALEKLAAGLTDTSAYKNPTASPIPGELGAAEMDDAPDVPAMIAEYARLMRERRAGYFDSGGGQREVGGSSFEEAQDDAKEHGKAYFVRRDNKVVEFDGDGNASMLSINGKEAFDRNDGTVHYVGNL